MVESVPPVVTVMLLKTQDRYKGGEQYTSSSKAVMGYNKTSEATEFQCR